MRADDQSHAKGDSIRSTADFREYTARGVCVDGAELDAYNLDVRCRRGIESVCRRRL